MKAITLHQPYATLVAVGYKRFETRSWSTKYRGPLAIHASTAFRTDPASVRARVTIRDTIDLNGWPPLPEDYYGAIIAVADLVDVIPAESRTWSIWDGEIVGNLGPGRFAWQLENVTPMVEPLQCAGRQRLWSPPNFCMSSLQKRPVVFAPVAMAS